VAYAEPANLGVDRFVAMIAAHALFDTACIIVDSGTAVTIDALSAEGRHQGGLILPGLTLMRRSLTKKTANINTHSRANGIKLFAKDTGDAVNSGTLRTIAAAIDEISADMEAELEGPVTQILCGGDAEMIRSWLRRDHTLYTDLVIKGLALIAGR
jgi:type III pantothenate kinase